MIEHTDFAHDLSLCPTHQSGILLPVHLQIDVGIWELLQKFVPIEAGNFRVF